MYDVARRDSFDNLGIWLNEIETYTTVPDVVKLLVGNKIDKENREISREEGAEFARSKNMLFIECSAKTQVGVQDVCTHLHSIPPFIHSFIHSFILSFTTPNHTVKR